MKYGGIGGIRVSQSNDTVHLRLWSHGINLGFITCTTILLVDKRHVPPNCTWPPHLFILLVIIQFVFTILIFVIS